MNRTRRTRRSAPRISYAESEDVDDDCLSDSSSGMDDFQDPPPPRRRPAAAGRRAAALVPNKKGARKKASIVSNGATSLRRSARCNGEPAPVPDSDPDPAASSDNNLEATAQGSILTGSHLQASVEIPQHKNLRRSARTNHGKSIIAASIPSFAKPQTLSHSLNSDSDFEDEVPIQFSSAALRETSRGLCQPFAAGKVACGLPEVVFELDSTNAAADKTSLLAENSQLSPSSGPQRGPTVEKVSIEQNLVKKRRPESPLSSEEPDSEADTCIVVTPRASLRKRRKAGAVLLTEETGSRARRSITIRLTDTEEDHDEDGDDDDDDDFEDENFIPNGARPDSDSAPSDSEEAFGVEVDGPKSKAQKTRKSTSKHSRARDDRSHMTSAQKREDTVRRKVLQNHPELEGIWDSIQEHDEIAPHGQPQSLKLKLLPYQKEGLSWMMRQENDFGGGLLADEMGMGKTISMLALLLTQRRSPTLILAPTVAIRQWSNEIDSHVSEEGKFSLCFFHGSNRVNDENELLKYDVVITSYSVVESAFRKQTYGFKRKAGVFKEPSALHQIHWERIVLDESHYIKDRSTNTARSVFELKGKSKWALSGTPVQNRVGEFYSVIRFLQLDPFAYYFCTTCSCKSLHWKFSDRKSCDDCGHKPMQHFCFWNQSILKPIQKYGGTGQGQVAFEKLNKILNLIMLRRTKIGRAADLGLPPRYVALRRDYFSEEEQDFYSSLYSDSKRKFSTYVSEGTVLNNVANIFELLTKMRLAANHPCLITSKLRDFDEDGTQLPGQADILEVCGLCHEPAEDPVTSKCRHTFCREDVQEYINTVGGQGKAKCPTCFSKLVIDLEAVPIVMTTKRREPTVVERMDMSNWHSSTKIEALVEELHAIHKEEFIEKSIVFSQFVSFLDLIHWRLRREGFNCVKLDGRMSVEQRDAVVQAFMTDYRVTVFLISLKAGGIALNLTEASRVFVMDPWWNPAAEDQAYDRVHRIGQKRPIKITRLIIQDSIEERIVQLQDKKKALFESTVGQNMSALARLSEEDFRFLFQL